MLGERKPALAERGVWRYAYVKIDIRGRLDAR
jgi:hypothetical protein